MKNLLKLVLMLGFTAGLALTISVLAYADEGEAYGKNARGWDSGQKILRMKERLGLSDDQVAKLKTVFDAEKTGMAPLLKQRRDDLKALDEKVKSGAKDEDLKPLISAIETDDQNLFNEGKKYIGQARDILTPAQQAKWILSNEGRGKHMRPNPEKKNKI